MPPVADEIAQMANSWRRDKGWLDHVAHNAIDGALVGALLLEWTGICKTGVARGSPRLPSRFRKGDIAPVCLIQIDFADNLHGCMHGKYGHAAIDYVYTFFDTRVCGGAVTAKTSLA